MRTARGDAVPYSAETTPQHSCTQPTPVSLAGKQHKMCLGIAAWHKDCEQKGGGAAAAAGSSCAHLSAILALWAHKGHSTPEVLLPWQSSTEQGYF